MRGLHRILLSSFALLLIHSASGATAPQLDCSRSVKRDTPHVIELTIADVPAIVRVPREISKPPIVLWHGFGPPASEAALMEALPLDDVPAIKVYLGLPLFGGRKPPGGMAEVGRRQGEDFAAFVFKPAVIGAAEELHSVVSELNARHCVGARERIGLFGFSAGGTSVLLSLIEHRVPIAAAVTLNASTGLDATIRALEHATGKSFQWGDESRALAHRTIAIEHIDEITQGHPAAALLLIQGASDTMLDPHDATALFEKLRPRFDASHQSQRVELLAVPGMTHNGLGEYRDTINRATTDWFNRFL